MRLPSTAKILTAALLLAAVCALAGCSAAARFVAARAGSPDSPQASSLATVAAGSVSAKYTDVVYASNSPAEKLDIYLPAGGRGPYPVILAIHGGGFRTGDKADYQIQPMLAALDRGYAVVSIGYRLSGEATWPAQINDAKAAVRFLRANAATYSLDPTRIVAWGDSAGGDLAALLGTSGGVSALSDPAQGDANESDRVQAVVDWFGPIDYAQMDPQFRARGLPTANRAGLASPESQLFGVSIAAVPEKVHQADAATYITPDDPPFLIEHGMADTTVPFEQSKVFAEKLRRVLGAEKVTLHLIPDAIHMDPAFSTPEHLATVLDWIDAQVK